MEELHDCSNRLVCMGDPITGLVESLYKGHKTSTYLAVGEEFKIERQDVVTTITLTNKGTFNVESHIVAA